LGRFLAEVGDSLVIGCEPPQQPHHFQIAMTLALQPPARLHAIEIAIDVELEVGSASSMNPAISAPADSVSES
jgi:hypothetical protein